MEWISRTATREGRTGVILCTNQSGRNRLSQSGDKDLVSRKVACGSGTSLQYSIGGQERTGLTLRLVKGKQDQSPVVVESRIGKEGNEEILEPIACEIDRGVVRVVDHVGSCRASVVVQIDGKNKESSH